MLRRVPAFLMLGVVFNVSITANLAAVTAPLFSSFGDDLTLWRDGNVVHWSYDGQTVIVEQQADGAADGLVRRCAGDR